MSETTLLGFEAKTGETVFLPTHHTVFVGITGIGKTLGIKALASRAPETTKFLILDVKSKRDYADFGTEIPIFMIKQTDPLMVKRLLETQGKMKLKFEFSELIKVTKSAKEKTWEGILETIDRFLEEKKHPVEEAKLLVLQHLLTRLIDEMKTVKVSDRLELPSKINVMDLSHISEELQQIPVHSVVSYCLAHKEELWSGDLFIVVDEAHRFIPEGESRGSKDTIIKAVKEGRSARLWLWFSDQSVTETEKGALKQCWNWLLSKQMELNETKRTLDQIPFKKELGITADEVQTLPIGFFVAVTDKFRKMVYVLPEGVPEEAGRKVALGELTPEQIRDSYLKKKEVEDELVWKEKYEELLRQMEKMRQQAFEEGQASLSKDVIEHNKFLADRVKELEAKLRSREINEAAIKNLGGDLTKANSKIEECEKEIRTLRAQSERAEIINELGEVLWRIIEPQVQIPPVTESTAPTEISVVTKLPAISVKVERKSLSLTDKDLEGKIAIIYANGEIPTDRWFTVTDIARMFEAHGWPKDPRTSKVLDAYCSWGFLEKRYSGKRPEYRTKMSPKEAREKNLLKIEESE